MVAWGDEDLHRDLRPCGGGAAVRGRVLVPCVRADHGLACHRHASFQGGPDLPALGGDRDGAHPQVRDVPDALPGAVLPHGEARHDEVPRGGGRPQDDERAPRGALEGERPPADDQVHRALGGVRFLDLPRHLKEGRRRHTVVAGYGLVSWQRKQPTTQRMVARIAKKKALPGMIPGSAKPLIFSGEATQRPKRKKNPPLEPPNDPKPGRQESWW